MSSRIVPLFALALTACPVAVLAEGAQPDDLDERVRCSAVFAVLARDQSNGLPEANAYPPIDKPGKAFFIATGQRLFAERKVDAQTVRSFFVGEVDKFRQEVAAAQDPKAHFAAVYNSCTHFLQEGTSTPK